MGIVLKLKKCDYQKIVEHCKNALPNEACGLVAGTIENGIKTITKVYLLTNMDASSSHFSMNPEEQLKTVKDARANGAEIIGSFHSHPNTPAMPSAEDKRLAYNPDMEYLILSLQELSHPVLRAFGITHQKNVVRHKIEYL